MVSFQVCKLCGCAVSRVYLRPHVETVHPQQPENYDLQAIFHKQVVHMELQP